MIPLFKVLMAADADQRVGEVLRSGYISEGPVVAEYERVMQETLALPDRPLAVNSGTSALHLALKLAGVGYGDYVLVSPMTCSATIVPIIHLGARPVWVDVDPVTGLMTPLTLSNAAAGMLPGDIRAVVSIDWAGTPCDYEGLRKSVDLYQKNVPIIQDAAHAMFAKDRIGRQIGATRDPNHYVCWSTQAIKLLTTGDGGLLLPPAAQNMRARKLRWFGLDRESKKDFRCEQDITEAGFKYHMNDISAAIGLANLPYALLHSSYHRRNAMRFYQAFKDLSPRVIVPPFNSGSSYWIYTILVDDRESFTQWMTEREIQVSQVHRRVDTHPAFDDAAKFRTNLPGLNEFAAHQISIPCHWALSESEVTQIIGAVTLWVYR
jgi:dTDP-4-amino-4,6-dideoxygalactose transaminase